MERSANRCVWGPKGDQRMESTMRLVVPDRAKDWLLLLFLIAFMGVAIPSLLAVAFIGSTHLWPSWGP